jgi:hypothetical protein
MRIPCHSPKSVNLLIGYAFSKGAMMLPSKFMLPSLTCRGCGFKGSLRRLYVKENQTSVGKTWDARLVKVKCIKCLQVFDYGDYDQPIEDVIAFRKLFYNL